ncbi:diguanylate cyclase domain-containing protein [Variovorax sp. RHLX14]|uniref:sensor domain-containing diguanylate cyclase n=1 Tax=Variovorax sp. RHLX14 TaxID=1259731 RepID=UPI003F47CAF1
MDDSVNDEARRLRALDSLQVLDTPPEAVFDDLAWLASKVLGMPISLVSLVSSERQWFKARCGLDLDGTLRGDGFCSLAIHQDGILEISDAREDDRFANLPCVISAPHVRFYAGAVLTSPDGHRFGTLCVLDTKPRLLSDEQREILSCIARRASDALEMRRQKLLAQSRESAISELLDVLPDGVVSCDASGTLKEFNGAARDWHGVDARKCPPEEWAAHFGLYDQDGKKLLQPHEIPLLRAWKGERVRGQTIVIRTPSQPPRTVNCYATPLMGVGDQILGAVCTMHDVTAQIQLARLLKKQALTDDLTGLPNRAAWFDQLDRTLMEARHANRSVTVMFIDLDGFKQVNDRHGHAAGDEVLRRFSTRLERSCRKGDFVARLAGDEFVVCLVQEIDAEIDPAQVKERIRQAMVPEIIWEGLSIKIGCSIGVAVQHAPDLDAVRLMESADQAMYLEKRERRADLR